MGKKEGGEEGLRSLLCKHYPGLAPERTEKMRAFLDTLVRSGNDNFWKRLNDFHYSIQAEYWLDETFLLPSATKNLSAFLTPLLFYGHF